MAESVGILEEMKLQLRLESLRCENGAEGSSCWESCEIGGGTENLWNLGDTWYIVPESRCSDSICAVGYCRISPVALTVRYNAKFFPLSHNIVVNFAFTIAVSCCNVRPLKITASYYSCKLRTPSYPSYPSITLDRGLKYRVRCNCNCTFT